jgi:hypothetical protein
MLKTAVPTEERPRQRKIQIVLFRWTRKQPVTLFAFWGTQPMGGILSSSNKDVVVQRLKLRLRVRVEGKDPDFASVPNYFPRVNSTNNLAHILLIGIEMQGKKTFARAIDQCINQTYDDHDVRRRFSSILKTDILTAIKNVESVVVRSRLDSRFSELHDLRFSSPENEAFFQHLRTRNSDILRDDEDSREQQGT